MNVSINSIAKDLGTTVHGVQTAITLFLLCMAALMIPGSKLTDRWGRKRCLSVGLTVYGTGAVIGAIAPGLRADSVDDIAPARQVSMAKEDDSLVWAALASAIEACVQESA